MTLQELLEAKDAAVADDDAKGVDLEEKKAALAAAEQAKTASAEARVAAHKAIHDLLAEFGHHYIVDDKGTVTIYLSDETENGWSSYHPVPGSPPTDIPSGHSRKSSRSHTGG